MDPRVVSRTNFFLAIEYAIDGRHLRFCVQMVSTQMDVLWSTYANGGPMAIPTLASVDSHVIFDNTIL